MCQLFYKFAMEYLALKVLQSNIFRQIDNHLLQEKFF